MQIQTLELVHNTTHVLTMPLAVLIAGWYAPRYGFNKRKAITYSLTIMLIIVVFTYACKWIPGWFGFTVHINAARTFIFVPLFAWALRKYWHISILQGIDFITPIIFFVRTVVLIGCTLLGCGQAIPCAWGIYSPSRGHTVFPMDLFDLIGTFVAGGIALIYARKLQYDGSGRTFALSMYILGFVRLFIQLGSTEYWWIRGLNDESIYSIVSITMTIVIYRNWVKNQKN